MPELKAMRRWLAEPLNERVEPMNAPSGHANEPGSERLTAAE
jgi:hypothetical protein